MAVAPAGQPSRCSGGAEGSLPRSGESGGGLGGPDNSFPSGPRASGEFCCRTPPTRGCCFPTVMAHPWVRGGRFLSITPLGPFAE